MDDLEWKCFAIKSCGYEYFMADYLEGLAALILQISTKIASGCR